jgi:hypothetical protein
MRYAELFLALLGLWLAVAPPAWGWEALAAEVGETRLVRFFLGFTLVILAGLLWEKNRMRSHIKVLVDALNRMLYGKDYAKHREAVDLLITAASGTNEEVRKNAVKSLEQITGQQFGQDVAAWRVWWEANRSTFSIRQKGKGKGGG